MGKNISRKNFLKTTGSVFGISSFGFPNLIIPKNKEKLGVALVGLGNYSHDHLAPALQKTEHCELRGIVTGTPSKIPVWQEKYRIPDQNVYNYENLHQVANNTDIDVVYIVLPPGLHAKYSIIAAESGKHVWCEKPMAMNVVECQAMIDAAKNNNVQLTIGYRMQHEPNTQTIINYGKKRPFGKITDVFSGAGFNGSHPDKNDWRRIAHLGGGALYDMGVYPINAIRYSTGMEPYAVRGLQSSKREMYGEVDEFTVFILEFRDGFIAKGESSFGNPSNYLEVDCMQGWYRLRPFQSITEVQGETSDGTEFLPDTYNQQARQMDNDAIAIKENKAPVVPGEDGLADIRIVNAIMESARRTGARIDL